ncbi:bifunctional isocitrate dehydrogenase kinase/phosphatase [Lysobacter sp. CFH 32150]|uniref:bifunctional isocitrate dehydrogenase kinase/phosphatase n=1 Tax=Lysobacter sp. CFH 32150 TaxID=2927128 RepID=UPI001FA7D38A|nr:bifunctional isocitrate dehydrogenase kinase/phosphatase [Lysobacter sp. CFH 32150]MCI4567970.1 bifunctional isocitrate dehydrogenase kinase/phosphatase [Lysobacter sp. CFH 32150]
MPSSRSFVATDPAQRAAALIHDAFDDYTARFSDITRRARRRFERRDWRLAQVDAVARIDLSEVCLKETLERLERLLDERLRSRPFWALIRRAYAERIATLPDRELLKTFFNSLSRRFFLTQGVVLDVEFHALEIEPAGDPTCPGELVGYPAQRDAAALWRAILADRAFANGYADLAGSAAAIAQTLQARLAAQDDAIMGIDLLRTVFYREHRAYLVGRVRGMHRYWPLVVALISDADGVRADALLTDSGQVSILFGYARSYFHADLARVSDTAAFLQTLLPHKPLDELYTVIGRAKHGKTVRYRQVFRHLAEHPHEQLVRAAGERGMVMSVFTPPHYPVVFKLIRDRFADPKDSTRRQVEEKYRLVFRRDRVGRLIDAQEFHRLRFDARQFAPDLLDELLRECAETVRLDGEHVHVAHCYVERRMRPLNLYVREATPEAALRAVLDYGQAIKDLARSNIFPGDLLLKNFGISRNDRAVFYDYDELCLLEQCRFRAIPVLREENETRPLDEWLYAARDDVFPELFPSFLGLPAPLRAALLREHGELFDPAWWREIQARLRAGEYLDVPPYPASARLPKGV